ncbi:MAG TPA: hypothetical protein VGI81_24055 [Tepidisphaeraceae bacterium]|jgi:hypothetical protein
MTLAPGNSRYARVALGVQLSLLGVIGIELWRRQSPQPPAALLAPPAPLLSDGNRLQCHIGDVDFSNTPFDTAIRWLARRSGESVGAEWNELQDIGVARTAPITLKLRNPTLADALDAVCARAPAQPNFEATYGESGGGVFLVGPATRNPSFPDGRLPTTTRVFNARDPLGPAIDFHPPTQGDIDRLTPEDLEARQDLTELANAVKTLTPDASVVAFATGIIVRGTPSQHRTAQLAIEALRHPIHIGAETNPPVAVPHGPLRIELPARVAERVLERLRDTTVALRPDFIGFIENGIPSDGDAILNVSGLSFDGTLGFVRAQFDEPYVVIPAGEDGPVTRVRPVQFEPGPRAYDVSSILAHSRPWIESFYSFPDQVSDGVENLIRVYCDPSAWPSDSRYPPRFAFWNGMLLVRQDPAVHRHILQFLEQLQRTGRPDGPPPEQ